MTRTELFLAAYAAEPEPWMAAHADAIRCFDVEDQIALGNLIFKQIALADAAWVSRVSAGEEPYEEEQDHQIGEYYKAWTQVSERHLARIEELRKKGFDVKGADEFMAHLEEARSILESRALEAEMRPIEELLPLAKGNPRPERYGL